jgi:hypothetical protein
MGIPNMKNLAKNRKKYSKSEKGSYSSSNK